MAREWTDAQRHAIGLRAGNILVSAAAGSGKTAVLVERIVSRILDAFDPVNIDEFLVMTFTKAAAAEMKERILLRLEEERERAQRGTALYERLKTQSAIIDCANISTIDSFCMRVLREHLNQVQSDQFLQGGMDPSFRVASEEDLLLLKEDVLDDLLEAKFEEAGEDFLAFADSFSGPRSDRKIAEYILLVYREAMGQPRPLEWIQNQASVLFSDFTPWTDFIFEEIRHLAALTMKEIDAAVALCQENEGPLGYLDSFLDDREKMEALHASDDFSAMKELLSSLEFRVIGRVKKGTNEEKKNAAKAIRDRYKEYFTYFKNEFSVSEERHALEKEKEDGFVAVLLSLTNEFIRRFSEKKREKNLVDFNDLEHAALSVLLDPAGNPTKAALEYRDAFREIYIDEYQDSNGIQEALIRSIEKGNVFMVGDIKQSIYGFRNARPALFLDKYHRYRNYDASEEELSGDFRIDLSMNFRSRNCVLQSVNLVFEQLMGKETGGIVYDEKAALYPGASFLEENGKEGRTALTSELLVYEEIRGEEEESRRRLEAKMVARRIRELVRGKGADRLLVQENGRLRPVQYRDIVILLRAATGWAEQFAEVFANEGIPAFADTGRGYFDSSEVLHILSFLSAIDNPYIDIPMAGFLKSSIIGINDRELAELVAWYRHDNPKQPSAKIFTMLTSAVSRKENPKRGENEPVEGDLEEELLQKIEKALYLLRKYRQDALFFDISHLIRKIYDETDYLNEVSAMPAGHVRRANLMMLIEKAKAYEVTGYRGLFHFIRYIEKLKSYEGDFGEAQVFGENEDMVRIMTIHKSKGLEFPVCFLCGTGKGFNQLDMREAVLTDPDFGIACDFIDRKKRIKRSSLKKNILKYKKKNEMLAEELRILYVAMTRAKELLIISASRTVKEEEKGSLFARESLLPVGPWSVLQGKSYLDWLIPAVGNASDAFFRRLLHREDLVFGEMEALSVQKDALDGLLSIESEDDESLTKLFYFSYPYARDITLHTKLSVSALKGDSDTEGDQKLWEAKEDAAKTASHSGGVHKGQVYHRLLEKLDFSGITDRKSFLDYLKDCENKGTLAPEERKLVRADDFMTLFNSDLGKRMRAAYEKGCLWREREFILRLAANEIDREASEETVLVQGVIDAYLEEENGIVLIDYKTDFLMREKEFFERYNTQLQYYALAIEGFSDRPVTEKIIWSFALGRAISC